MKRVLFILVILSYGLAAAKVPFICSYAQQKAILAIPEIDAPLMRAFKGYELEEIEAIKTLFSRCDLSPSVVMSCRTCKADQIIAIGRLLSVTTVSSLLIAYLRSFDTLKINALIQILPPAKVCSEFILAFKPHSADAIVALHKLLNEEITLDYIKVFENCTDDKIVLFSSIFPDGNIDLSLIPRLNLKSSQWLAVVVRVLSTTRLNPELLTELEFWQVEEPHFLKLLLREQALTLSMIKSFKIKLQKVVSLGPGVSHSYKVKYMAKIAKCDIDLLTEVLGETAVTSLLVEGWSYYSSKIYKPKYEDLSPKPSKTTTKRLTYYVKTQALSSKSLPIMALRERLRTILALGNVNLNVFIALQFWPTELIKPLVGYPYFLEIIKGLNTHKLDWAQCNAKQIAAIRSGLGTQIPPFNTLILNLIESRKVFDDPYPEAYDDIYEPGYDVYSGASNPHKRIKIPPSTTIKYLTNANNIERLLPIFRELNITDSLIATYLREAGPYFEANVNKLRVIIRMCGDRSKLFFKIARNYSIEQLEAIAIIVQSTPLTTEILEAFSWYDVEKLPEKTHRQLSGSSYPSYCSSKPSSVQRHFKTFSLAQINAMRRVFAGKIIDASLIQAFKWTLSHEQYAPSFQEAMSSTKPVTFIPYTTEQIQAIALVLNQLTPELIQAFAGCDVDKIVNMGIVLESQTSIIAECIINLKKFDTANLLSIDELGCVIELNGAILQVLPKNISVDKVRALKTFFANIIPDLKTVIVLKILIRFADAVIELIAPLAQTMTQAQLLENYLKVFVGCSVNEEGKIIARVASPAGSKSFRYE